MNRYNHCLQDQRHLVAYIEKKVLRIDGTDSCGHLDVIHAAIKLKAFEVSKLCTISWQPQQAAVSHLKNHFWQFAVHALFKNQHFELTITFIVIGPEERIQEFFL